jgi:stage III sporulation protein AB
MLKGVGICLIIGGCIGLGWYMVSRYAARLRMLGEAEQAFHFLYGQIEYSGCDMIELLDKLARRGGSFGGVWHRLAEDLKQYDGQCFAQHWRKEMGTISDAAGFTQGDWELLMDIGENLGNTDRFTQLRTLEVFQERLHGGIEQARAEYREKAKVSMVVSLTIGFFLTLLLL